LEEPNLKWLSFAALLSQVFCVVPRRRQCAAARRLSISCRRPSAHCTRSTRACAKSAAAWRRPCSVSSRVGRRCWSFVVLTGHPNVAATPHRPDEHRCGTCSYVPLTIHPDGGHSEPAQSEVPSGPDRVAGGIWHRPGTSLNPLPAPPFFTTLPTPTTPARGSRSRSHRRRSPTVDGLKPIHPTCR
jgi:hypothetical protein